MGHTIRLTDEHGPDHLTLSSEPPKDATDRRQERPMDAMILAVPTTAVNCMRNLKCSKVRHATYRKERCVG